MQQKLSIAIQTLYSTRKDNPHAIRMMIRMCDPIERCILCSAVDVTMQRYPYFCVELRKNDGQYVFEHNTRPVVISDTLEGTQLNSEGSNYHMIAFSAVNGRFIFDFIQPFSDPVYVNGFLQELKENGVAYEFQDVKKLTLPNIKLPWSE